MLDAPTTHDRTALALTTTAMSGIIYETTEDTRSLAKQVPTAIQQGTNEEKPNDTPCRGETLERGRSTNTDELILTVYTANNHTPKPNNVTSPPNQIVRSKYTAGDIPYMLCIPTSSTTAIYKSLSSLPADAVIRLKAAIYSFCLSTPERGQRYARYLTSDADDKAREARCLLSYSICKSTVVPAYKPHPGRACDTCSKSTTRVCPRVRRIEGVIGEVLVIFPKSVREGVRWRNLGFWL
jgi:hypothetical protein